VSVKVLEFNGVNKEYMLIEGYQWRLFSVYRNAQGDSSSVKANQALEQSLLLPPPLREQAFVQWCLAAVIDGIAFEQIVPDIH